MASGSKPVKVVVATAIGGSCAWANVRRCAHPVITACFTRPILSLVPRSAPSAAPIPEAARGDPDLVCRPRPDAAVPRHDRSVRDPRVGGDGPADPGGPGGRGLDAVHGDASRRSRPWPTRRRRTCCGRGRDSATTGGRSTSSARRGSSSTSTAGGSRATSAPSRPCPASGRTRRGPSRRWRSGSRSGAVDTNVRRVLGRIVAGDVGVLDAATLQQVADEAVPPDRPGFWTHALMDIGATLCTPRRPLCEACPAQPWCRYAAAPPTRRAASARRPRDAPPPSHHLALAPRPDRRAAPRRPERGVGRARRPDRRPRPGRGRPGARRARPGRRRPNSTRPTEPTVPAAPGSRHDPAGRLRFPGDARDRPTHLLRCRRAAACGRSGDLHDGPPRPARSMGRPGRHAGHLGRGDGRCGRARAGVRVPAGSPHGARRDGGRGRGSRPRRGPRPVGERSHRHPVRPRQQRRRRLRRRPAPGPRRCARHRRGRRHGHAAERRCRRPGTGTGSRATSGSPRSTSPVPRDVAIFGKDIAKAAVVVDALLGTGVRGALREPIRAAVELIADARAAGVPIVAVDTPTAVDLSSGEPSDPVVHADLTVTFHRAKTGLADAPGRRLRGARPRRPDRDPRRGRPWLSRRRAAAPAGLARGR